MTDVVENIDLSEFKSIHLVIEEARHGYDEESTRTQTLENKAGVILAAEAIMITLLSIFKDSIVCFKLIFGVLIISFFFGLLIIKPEKFKKPGKTEEYYKYTKMEEKEFLDTILTSYYDSIKKNKQINDRKLGYLLASYLLLLLVFLSFILSAF